VDKQMMALLIPIMALAIPITAVVMSGLHRIWRLRVEEARARAQMHSGEGQGEITALREEVGQLREELTEVHERLDFTERVLGQVRERQQLPQGRDVS
jgi:hypothetical protein